MRLRSPAALAAILALALLAPAAARAQSAVTASPCTGLLHTDVEGDEQSGPDALHGGTGSPNRVGQDPYIDITAVFFNYGPGVDGAPVLTANIRVRDLTVEIPEDSYDGKAEYIVEFTNLGGVDWVRAVTDGEEWTFDYGEIVVSQAPNGRPRSRPQPTTGRVFPGPSGVVQIDFPAGPDVKPGAEVTDAIAFTGIWTSTLNGRTSTWIYSDRGPDEGEATYVLTPCPPPPPPPKPPANDDPYANIPYVPPAPPAGGPESGTLTEPALHELPVRIAATMGSARRALKARRLTARVEASRPVRRLKLTLKKRGNVVAQGRRRRLARRGAVQLRLLTRRLPAGSYTLIAVGEVNGRELQAMRRIRIGR